MILNLNTQEQHNAVSMQPHFYGYPFVTDSSTYDEVPRLKAIIAFI